MRTIGMVVGILGGAAGLIASAMVLHGAERDVWVRLSSVGLAASALGLVGATLAPWRPRLAIALMIVSAIVGVAAVTIMYAPAAALLAVSSLLVFLGRRD